MGRCQVSLEVSIARVGVGQLLPDGERLAVGGPRPGRVARLGKHVAGQRVAPFPAHLEPVLGQASFACDFLRQRPRLLERFERASDVARRSLLATQRRSGSAPRRA